MLCFTLCLPGHSKGQHAGEPGSNTAGQVHSDEPGPRLSQKAGCRLERGSVGLMAGQGKAVESRRPALLWHHCGRD